MGISLAIIAFLFVAEFHYYLSIDTNDSLQVDRSRKERLEIVFNISFTHVPCTVLHLDLVDVSGVSQINVQRNVYKTRLQDPISMTPIGSAIHEKFLHQPFHQMKLNESSSPDYCGSCYGAEAQPGDCCNSCEAVMAAFKHKGWTFINGDKFEQCIREKFLMVFQQQYHEGCQMHGHISVSKVAGNVHFAPFLGYQLPMNAQNLINMRQRTYNMSHHFNSFGFGQQYPGIANPLQGLHAARPEGGGLFQYYTKVVPTVYHDINENSLRTNQYSVTEHTRGTTATGATPGVFIYYDISPIMVQFRESRPAFYKFLTSACAILGGVFSVAGILDKMLHATFAPQRAASL